MIALRTSSYYPFLCTGHLEDMAYFKKIRMFIYGRNYRVHPEIPTKYPVKLYKVLEKYENIHII